MTGAPGPPEIRRPLKTGAAGRAFLKSGTRSYGLRWIGLTGESVIPKGSGHGAFCRAGCPAGA